MNIPDHFEFHYVQNGVKKSVTLLTEALFRDPLMDRYPQSHQHQELLPNGKAGSPSADYLEKSKVAPSASNSSSSNSSPTN